MGARTRLWAWQHDGFHGGITIRLRVPLDAVPGDVVWLSAGQARRLRRLCCGMTDCRCGEGAVQYQACDPGAPYVVLPQQGEIAQGDYPKGE